eukprot:TRINITY_DN9186_c0_g1_i1.p1 TRINITY_DN9186_c0_g1~~TRINITY_DN9186_c0_g1_i1.p1  ORF type:complete len:150 (-),score=36.81 TRINITY_DN9186_c0_g1_i1:26-475(-)
MGVRGRGAAKANAAMQSLDTKLRTLRRDAPIAEVKRIFNEEMPKVFDGLEEEEEADKDARSAGAAAPVPPAAGAPAALVFGESSEDSNTVKSTLKSILSWMSDILQRFWAWLKQKCCDLFDSVCRFFGWIASKIKSAFGVSAPAYAKLE